MGDGMTKGTDESIQTSTALLTIEDQAALLDLAHDAIFVRDLDTARIVYWNDGAHKLFGWTAAESLGRASHELLHTEFPVPLRDIERTVLDTGLWEGELVHLDRSGNRVVVLSRWAVRRDEHGDPIGFLEINRDITARKIGEQQIEQLLAERERRLTELGQAHSAVLENHRQQKALNVAVQSITSDLDLERVLQHIVDEARDLIGAGYAALGVADDTGRIL